MLVVTRGAIVDYKGIGTVIVIVWDNYLCQRRRQEFLCCDIYYLCKLLHKWKCTKSTVSLEFLNAKVTVFVPIISTHKNIFSPEC